ncbi:MAG: hypothetical protein Q4C71_05505 [Microbacteriaceae bacterium]|nr:hypothetical protein [Microbacteriaceae bacterium]
MNTLLKKVVNKVFKQPARVACCAGAAAMLAVSGCSEMQSAQQHIDNAQNAVQSQLDSAKNALQTTPQEAQKMLAEAQAGVERAVGADQLQQAQEALNRLKDKFGALAEKSGNAAKDAYEKVKNAAQKGVGDVQVKATSAGPAKISWTLGGSAHTREFNGEFQETVHIATRFEALNITVESLDPGSETRTSCEILVKDKVRDAANSSGDRAISKCTVVG